MEVWKNCLGYEDVLEISNYGNVKRKPFVNYKSYKNPRFYKGGVLKPFFCGKKNGIGYPTIEINKKNLSIHKLVCETFIKKIDNGFCVNHKDGNTKNNHIDNLEIITNLENIRHGKLNREKFTSRYIGVSKIKNKFRISLMNNSKLYTKQGFNTEQDAYNYLIQLRNSLGLITKY
jgi:hypothetical protein